MPTTKSVRNANIIAAFNGGESQSSIARREGITSARVDQIVRRGTGRQGQRVNIPPLAVVAEDIMSLRVGDLNKLAKIIESTRRGDNSIIKSEREVTMSTIVTACTEIGSEVHE